MRPIGSISWNWLLTNPSLTTGDSLPIVSMAIAIIDS